MTDPRSTSTRRAALGYDHLKDLYEKASPPIKLPDLLIKDYQGIFQDFIFTSDEIDLVDVRVINNENDIADLQNRVEALEYRAYKIIQTTGSLTSTLR